MNYFKLFHTLNRFAKNLSFLSKLLNYYTLFPSLNRFAETFKFVDTSYKTLK